MSIRVLLVDDQPLLRTGFRLILESEPQISVVGEAADGHAAVADTKRLLPDVVLMDIRMPGKDGIDATREILEWAAGAGQQVRVLVLTTFDLDEYVVEALRAGASGFLLKDVPPDELASAIRVVSDGAAIVAPTITRRLLDRFAHHLPTTRERPEPRLELLTEREREVLRLLARGMSNAEIARRLVVSETTVKTHVGNVLTKLGLRDRVQAVVHAYETGIVRPGEE
ncbi:response regulator [Streptomonospora nanhaiensis]|uniref:DNA-binding NarL/FixJ family response regulator n=1 Tax=Streptomonospora nanhaiensis TaxID=1323731 RepID=A0A853BIY8_9ACTN|nr:response regulator transcription factor [Streptomonospora nanhaiensis]MBV2363382.1 response regulator transcription factor [Streptomonospora nanhaiensis]MBX9389710.1 response regulator transcription factor [Streptomonospora nanhaiensis]NYI94561.1 DNA-binding NarL/FixJ family response regulator [Streptomonospora nanhaiensis]